MSKHIIALILATSVGKEVAPYYSTKLRMCKKGRKKSARKTHPAP